jgi:hypothetical protein
MDRRRLSKNEMCTINFNDPPTKCEIEVAKAFNFIKNNKLQPAVYKRFNINHLERGSFNKVK